MAAFRFKALDTGGKSQTGMIEAATPAAARQVLRGRGLLPLDVQASAASKGPAQKTGARIGSQKAKRNAARMPLAQLTLVTRQMATLLGAGLRIEDALSTIAEGQPPKTAGILLTLRGSVLEGRSFADALTTYPQVFSDFYQASIRAGEQAGKLGHVMTHLAAFVEGRARNRQTVQLALLYPALLALVSLSIITLLMAFVVPDIVRVFQTRGTVLPFLTRALISMSSFVRGYGLLAGLGLTLLLLGFGRWVRVPRNRMAVHQALAKGRLTSRLVQRSNAAQFAGTLATLVQSGVPLVEALAAAADVTPNLYIRSRVATVADSVRQGISLRRAMEEAAVFPAMLVAMVASGEATGSLGPALAHAAEDQQRDLDAWLRAMVALVEPAILLVMGGLVMVMVLAILLPIVSMNGLVGG